MESAPESTTRIILVRHGHVAGISPERFRGRRDVPLSELGTRQATLTARRIAREWRPVTVYSSPLERCVQTAGEIAAACNAPAAILDELNDIDYGDCEWCTHEEVRARWPALYEGWLAAPHTSHFPRGESLQEVAGRMAAVWRLIAEKHRRETVIVVGHSVCNRVFLLQALAEPLSAYWGLGQDPCGVSEIELLERGTTVRRMNETHHLSGT